MAKIERELYYIQILRGFAAILVVLCHSIQFTSAFLNVSLGKYIGVTFGNFGVDIFFVISGFIMVYISYDKFGSPGASFSFLTRRLLRIFPIYWVIMIVELVLIIPTGLFAYAFPVSQHFVIEEVRNFYYVLSSFILIPYFDSTGTQVFPVIGVAWTLIFEMFFYYVFSILLLFKKDLAFKLLYSFFTLLVLIFYLIKWLSFFHHQTNILPYIILYSNPVIFEFIFGCFIAERYLAGKVLSHRAAYFGIVVSVFMFIMNYQQFSPVLMSLPEMHLIFKLDHVRLLGWGIPAAVLVYSVLSLEARGMVKAPQFLISLGDASYSIYLTHFAFSLVLLFSFFKVLSKYFFVPGNVAVLITWVVAIFIGLCCYRYIEAPLLKYLKHYFFSKRSVVLQEGEGRGK